MPPKMQTEQENEGIKLAEVQKLLNSKGYPKCELTQSGRFALGIIYEAEGDKPLFFKLALAEEQNLALQNEASWYEFNTQLGATHQLAITSPQLLETGTHQNRNWYIREYVQGEPLLPKEEQISALPLEPYLPQIWSYLQALHNLDPRALFPNTLLPIDYQHFLEYLRKSKLKAAQDWAAAAMDDSLDSKLNPKLAKELINLIETRVQHLQLRPTHSDFVPWHIIKTADNKLKLIDPERGAILGPDLYDLSYLAHRLYTFTADINFAHTFLIEGVRTLALSEAEVQALQCLLAARTVGGLWECYVQKWRQPELDLELAEKLITGQIF